MRTLPLQLGVSLVLLAGCASGGAESDADTTRRRDSGGGVDGSTVVCLPRCIGDEVCVEGRCVVPGTDLDEDGVEADLDCDDADPSVGRMTERTCTSACGTGVERCTDGSWEACTAPETCDCTPGEPAREIECERCGTQRQVCVDGSWTNDGVCMTGACSPGETRMAGACGDMCGTLVETCQADCSWGGGTCMESGSCAPGDIDRETRACTCGGSEERTRSCGATCEWGTWGAWSGCSAGACTPGETEEETRSCACGGTERRTRTCSASCTWGGWGGWSGCAAGECTPGATRACPDRDSPCTEQVCTASCTWGSCGLVAGAACDHVSDSGVAGGRWRCCPSGAVNEWQFCLSSCQWSTACAACSSCGCP